MPENFTAVVDIRLNSVQLPDAVARRVVSARVDTSVDRPASFEIVFQDDAVDLLQTDLANARIGATVAIAPLTDGKPGERLVTGEVTGLCREMDAARRKRLVLRGHDLGHRLTRRRKVKAYPGSRASDIARKIFGENGVSIGAVDATTAQYDYATQPNITDWDYLARLARQNDRRLSVDRDGKARFARTTPASQAPTGTRTSDDPRVVSLDSSRVHHCRIDVSASALTDGAEVRGWDVKTKRALSSAVRDLDTPAVAGNAKPNTLKRRIRTQKVVATAEPLTTQAQVKAAADALAEDVASSVVELEAAVDGDAKLIAGEPISVVDAGQQFNGKYTVTAARHLFAEAAPGGRYTTEIEVSGRQDRSLHGLAVDGAGAGGPTAAGGLAVAVVKDVKAPAQHKGKVKLEFPWLSADYESDWCRVVQFGGVKGGGLNLPNTGDEVVVGFDRASLEHPYVIAGLYNGRDRLPKLDGKDISWSAAGVMDWRTLASRDGHRLELHDGVGRKGAKVSTGDGGHSIHLDQSGTRIVVDSTGEVSISARRDVSVTAGGSLSLSAARDVRIDGTSVAITARAAGSFRAAELALTGGAAANLSATGAVGITAGGVARLSAAGAATINAGGAATITAGAAATLTGGAAIALTTLGDTAITASAIQLVTELATTGVPPVIPLL